MNPKMVVHSSQQPKQPLRQRTTRRIIILVLFIGTLVTLNLRSLQEFVYDGAIILTTTNDSDEAEQLLFPNDQQSSTITIIPNQYTQQQQHHHSNSTTTNASTNNIRRWGCHRHETPLIFVHLGKAGGGSIRARMAAAAVNYNRGNQWHQPQIDKHYYPIMQNQPKRKRHVGFLRDIFNYNNQNFMKGKFCNSQYSNHRIPNSIIQPHSFEGNSLCNATTPLGLAIACPEHNNDRLCMGCDDFRNSPLCNTIYVGHNNIGSELHWLPPKYLQSWWTKSPWSSSPYGTGGVDDPKIPEIDSAWKTLLPSPSSSSKSMSTKQEHDHQKWCFGTHYRPMKHDEFDESYHECSLPIAETIDKKFQTYWNNKHRKQLQQQQGLELLHHDNDYSLIYSSLPVQRVTVLREPFSWLISKFFFHKRFREGYACDGIEEASQTWALRDTLTYLFQYCGDDCMIRYENGLVVSESDLYELELQATNNIRNSFSVVGIFEDDMETFYDMLHKRVGYVDMSSNIHVEGNSHQREESSESERCNGIFLKDEGFQKDFIDRLPTLGIIQRLYQVAIEVNQFQQDELKECK